MTRFFRNLALATTALLPLGIGFALAGPTGGVVVGGDATIRDQGTRNVTIDQWSRRAIINWYTFNIGEGETTRFIQPDAGSVVLNRVTGGVGPSEIFGTLTANGRVFVINRDGILFGPNSVVDTAGFLATTSDIKNEDFMAGRYNFNIPGRPDASIVNHGTITAHSAGFAALVAPGVRNTGTITATLGTVGLAAGNSFTLDLYGDRLITLAVGDSIAGQVRDVQTGQTLNSLVENSGRLRANGGRVELTAAAARTVVDSVINNTGVVEANRIGQHGGTIVLSAATAATKGADAPKQTIKLSGTLSAAAKKGGKGGKVVVTGEDIKLTAAHVDVSGPAGGGTVLIGGDWGGGSPRSGVVKHSGARLESEAIPTAATVTIDRNTVINASATASGTGGKVIVWSDEKTSFAGTILATGGPSGGDGGFAEVSGHLLDFKGAVDLRAPMGKVGTLLLDPLNYYINNSGEAPENDPNASAIAASTVQTLLQTAHVTITTQAGAGAGDIFVQSSITWATAFSLTLSAFRDINVGPGVTIANTYGGASPGTLLTLRADNTGTGSGTVHFAAGGGFQCGECFHPPGKIDFSQSTGKVAIYYNPPSFDGENRYLNPVDYRTNVLTNQGIPNQLTAYMLVNNAGDLSAIGENSFTLAQTYALGTSFWADEFNGFGAGTRFTGIFDGYGGIGQNNNSISGLTSALFPIIGKDGIVRNLDLRDVFISATGDNQFIGALAGRNEGTISNVRLTVSDQIGFESIISGGSFAGIVAGGLVGLNLGTITQSSASATIAVIGDGVGGGLVGQNDGVIVSSSAGGHVIGIGGGIFGIDGEFLPGTFVNIGGLVGVNHGTVQDSSATASVVGLFANAGGLVGFNSGSIIGTNPGQVRADGIVIVDGDNSTGGGLVGLNAAGGTILNAGATGSVTGGLFFGGQDPIFATSQLTKVGGLVGQNAGSIDHSVAAVTVQAGFGSAGGLVGQNDGLIAASSASGAVSGLGFNGESIALGGLVGSNTETGQITGSSASGAVVLGTFGNAGGLVGENDGTISGSSASGAVTAFGLGTSIGGLVGFNGVGASISNSLASGDVTSFGNGVIGSDFTTAGGLVGRNFGTLTGTSASGAVSVGAAGMGGGLVGLNGGLIATSFATGAVIGAAGLDPDHSTRLGGLAGVNQGTISGSSASGSVGSAGIAFLSVGGLVGINSETGQIIGSTASGLVALGAFGNGGGLVGYNSGAITNASASGAVTADGLGTSIGGLVGFNNVGAGISNSQASGNVTSLANATSESESTNAGGLVGRNLGSLASTSASGAVRVGAHGAGGGLVGFNVGTIATSFATGAVTGAAGLSDLANTHLGGLAGVNQGSVTDSYASGDVGAAGVAFLAAGGLVGDNMGTILRSFALGNVRVGDHGTAGGLVGDNDGQIADSRAGGSVTGGSASIVGGLAGSNSGSLSNTLATGAVSGGSDSIIGGLVAVLDVGATITNSQAEGSVSGLGIHSILGGLVGVSFGTIASSSAAGDVTAGSQSYAGGLVGINLGNIQQSLALSSVSVTGTGTNSILGGLVGMNVGTINLSTSSASVSGGAFSSIGGLVGANVALLGLPPGLTINGSSFPVGTITQSSAFGAVSGGPGSHVGGLIGDNGGSISGLTAGQSVIGGDGSIVGGLVGRNGGPGSTPGLPSIFSTCTQAVCIAFKNATVSSAAGSIANSHTTGDVSGGIASVVGGLVGENPGLITESTASGLVIGGDGSTVGGLVGRNVLGRITLASASSTVIGGHGSMVGGLVGFNLAGLIQDSFATGSVSGGDGSIAGGLVAANLGTVSRSFASGAVTGGDSSHVGGLVGVNYTIPGFGGDVASGAISQSYATGAVTGGAASTVGGLVADNGGTIDQTYATGLVTGGPGSTTGGLIGVDNASFVVPDGLLAGASAPDVVGAAAIGGTTQVGTVTFSYWDKQTTGQTISAGGTGLTTAQLNAGLPVGFDPAVWSVLPGQSYPFLQGQPIGTIQPIGPLPPPDVTLPLFQDLLPPPPTQQVVDVRQTDSQPATAGEVVSTQPTTTGSTGSRPSNQASGNAPLRPDGRPSNVPPVGETRFINNEVVFQICGDVPAQRIQTTIRRLRLNVLSSQSLGLIGCTVYHSRITTGRSVRDIIIALERDRLIDEVTPNYTFALAQDASTPAPATEGNGAQYAIAKLRLTEAHQLAKGDNVLIAVIDSEIDAKHPDLEGAIAGRYDAVGPADKPHPHGTGMAGAIASHRKLIGTAPGARILAIRAFGGGGSAGAQGTTVQIVKGIDWAIGQGAKIVNMSFAGPKDPTLQKAFKAAHDKGVVLIAAAGNAGPKSPPLYPGADANVIAVSATDADDKVYTNANRGKYVAVAAPGVDILVPAPEGNYEFTTGTSVASAEVSGVAALLLQLEPKIDPATVREVLTSTANRLGAKDRTDELGYGLVDAYRALLSVNAKSASAPGAVAATSRN